MKRIILGAIVLCSLVPGRSAAQHRGMFAGGGRAAGVNAGSFYGTQRGNRGFARNFGFGWGAGFGWGYPDFGWDFADDDGQGYGNPSVPSVVIVMPPQQTLPPAPPPEPTRPVIHEYKQAEAASEPSATFSIVTKNGATQNAVAVWVQDNSVNFITPDGGRVRVPLTSVDREATRRANAEKHLMLSLPEERIVQAS
jgi:hypothetical protein